MYFEKSIPWSQVERLHRMAANGEVEAISILNSTLDKTPVAVMVTPRFYRELVAAYNEINGAETEKPAT